MKRVAPEVTDQILDADFANILKKVKAGKPLTAVEREVVEKRRGEEAKKNASKGKEAQQKASSLKHAAGLLGLPGDILKAAKAAGCPGFDDHNRVDCGKVREWLEANRELLEARGPMSKEQAEVKRILLMCERIAFQLEVLKGQYTKNTVLAEGLKGLAAEQKSILRRQLENELPARIAGQPVTEVRKVLRCVVDEICARMERLGERWLTLQEGVEGRA